MSQPVWLTAIKLEINLRSWFPLDGFNRVSKTAPEKPSIQVVEWPIILVNFLFSQTSDRNLESHQEKNNKYVVNAIGFKALKIVVDTWIFSMLLLYIIWDDWPIFMILGSNEQLQQQLEYTLLNPYCHRWWISKMQSGRKDTLEEEYAIKFCFKLGKSATETYGMLQTAFGASCINWASVFEWHKRFKEGRESMRDDEMCGRSKEVNTLKLIGSIVQTLLPLTFAYSLSSEAVVMRELRRWKRLWRRSLTRSHKRTSMAPSRSCWNGTTSELQPEEFPVCTINKSAHTSGNLFNDLRTCLSIY